MIRGILGKTTIASDYLQNIVSKDYNLQTNTNGINNEVSHYKINLNFPNFPAIDTDSNLQSFSYKSFLESQFQQTIPPRTLSKDNIDELRKKKREYSSWIQASLHEEYDKHDNVTQSIFVGKNAGGNEPQKKKIFEPEDLGYNPFEKENSKEYQFMEITNCHDFNIVKKYLNGANNDVQAAITNYFQANGYGQ